MDSTIPPPLTPNSLSPHQDNPDALLVQKTRMGNTEAYLGSVSLAWVAERVGFAAELPLFQQQRDPKTANISINAETIDTLYQRPLNWSRQAPLTQYLAGRRDRKFPPLLAVISPDWVDNPQASQWGDDGRAKQAAADLTPLDNIPQLALLNLPPSISIFALDGQHRLMGIQGLMTLLQTGTLQPLSRSNNKSGTPLNLDRLAAANNTTPDAMQALANDTVGIELIPAVLTGETREEARQRIRSIFVHVNLMAVKLSKGQVTLLDEDDGFAIISRQIAVTHPLLRDDDSRPPRINWDGVSVSAKSQVLTTLQALRDMTVGYLTPRFPHWLAAYPGTIPPRPTADDLAEGLSELMRLWDGLGTLPSYKRMELGVETLYLRRFSFEAGGGEGNFLFRPVGQVALAQALGIVIFQRHLSVVEALKRLQKFDDDGGFQFMELPQSLWYGVLYNPNKRRIRVSGKDLAKKLLIYLLGGMQENQEIADLRLELAKARTFENRAVSFEGKFVTPREVGMPKMIES